MSEEEERVLHGWNPSPGIHRHFCTYAFGPDLQGRLRETGANKCEAVHTVGLDGCLDCSTSTFLLSYLACSIVTFDGELKVRTTDVGCYMFDLLNKNEKWFLAYQYCNANYTVLENGDQEVKQLGVLPATLVHSFHRCSLILLTKNKIIVGNYAGNVYVIVF
jgi:hypothetical protein